jgi:hypothetical protein
MRRIGAALVWLSDYNERGESPGRWLGAGLDGLGMQTGEMVSEEQMVSLQADLLWPGGNHFAAMSGASLRELMGRMGHVRMDAALIYQHRTLDRDRSIADSLDAMLRLVEE